MEAIEVTFALFGAIVSFAFVACVTVGVVTVLDKLLA